MLHTGYNGRFDRQGRKIHGRASQNWTIGATVNVGFLKNLTVKEKVATPGDYRPDAYILEAASGARYEFVPHCGLSRIN
ncbi:MAG: hypothetical protein J0H10_15955 [Alphaproteobacteria bacterium]|nr:hypothetical protein [Alphaproteobacteria bacterium]